MSNICLRISRSPQNSIIRVVHKNMTGLILFICLLLTIDWTTCSSDCAQKEAVCTEQSSKTCADCTMADPCCVWLYDKEIPDEVHRCNVADLVDERLHMVKGGASSVRAVGNEPFSEGMFTNDEAAVQIRPQRVNAYLRKDQPVTFQLAYKAVKNYPLDLYYLMDLTFSMKPHRQQLIDLGYKLAGKLRDMTSNYKIAFGFYSDKVVMPYSTMLGKHMDNPCAVLNQHCEKAYNFKHSLNFSQDLASFIEKVNASTSTANMDDLEGGLDALMQIIVCQKELKWRKHSRKFVILATDGLLHSAGDGILGGITKRNNGRCRLERDGEYLVYNGLEYDYPSVEEIHRKLIKNKINVLFAVNEKVKPYYKELNKLMRDVTSLGLLTNEPENILDLVELGYRKLVQQVAFTAITDDDNLKITFESTCNKATGWNTTDSCDNIVLGDEYVFNVTLELLDWPTSKGRKLITIEEMNIEEKVTIEVEYASTCDCSEEERVPDLEHGVFECGKYVCNPGWIGEFCNKTCDRNAGRFQNETYKSATCLNRGDFDTEECKCNCDREYSGEFCEYKSCPRIDGRVCNDKGRCVHGECQCYSDYMGNACGCPVSTKTCTNEKNGKICSGRGSCSCGKCTCKSEISTDGTNITYYGKYCERCSGCKNLCEDYKEQAIAAASGRKDASKNLFDGFVMTLVENLDNIDGDNECLTMYKTISEYCTVAYKYRIDDGIVVFFQQPICAKFINAAKVGAYTFGGVVLSLLCAVFVYKVVTTVQDRAEWARYEKDRGETEYKELNPLYQSPISTFKNPMVAGSSEL